MWHALRAELAYARPYLVGGLGIAAGVVAILTVVFAVVGDDGPPAFAAAGMRAMFLVMAPLIAGFVIQSYRLEERRSRLLLAGPLTPRDLATVTVLLPAVLFAIGVAAAVLGMAVETLVTGRFVLESANIAGFVGGQIFTYTQLGLLIQEAVAAQRQGRTRAAAAGWAGLALAAVFLAGLYLALARQLLSWGAVLLALLAIAVATMAAVRELYAGRTDFTR